MKRPFDDILAECLEAVTAGQRTIEECLALYPTWSDRLEPLLRLGRRLGEASFSEPDPAYSEAARGRFLAAIQARAERPRPRRRLLPALPSLEQWRGRLALNHGARRGLATAAAALLLAFFGFSSFVVASAGDSLPGDWRYPVKRLTERTRLTFTLGENARRGYRISLAEERLHEVKEMATRDRTIGESDLRQLLDSTQPLVQALEPNSVPADQIERITDLTAQQQDVLDDVAPLVEEDAADELQQAIVVSSEGHAKAVEALAVARSSEASAREVSGLMTPTAGASTPGVGASPTAGLTPGASPTAESSATPGQGGAAATPAPESTPVPGEATPVPGEPAPELPTPTATASAPVRQVASLPDDTTGGISWSLMTIGDFSLRVPAEDEADWVVSSLTGTIGERTFVGHRLGNRFDAVIVVDVSTGDTSVQVLVQGVFQQMPAEEVPSSVPGPVADVLLHVLGSVNAGP